MKKTVLAIVLLVASVVNAQKGFYMSASTGYSFAAGEKALGSSGTLGATGLTNTSELKGSYGEGLHLQLRGGYFFNDKIGLELSLGYLYGSDQEVNQIGGILDMKARGRAFGASLSAVYNITKNFYARAGYLTKIGGKTEAVTSLTLPSSLTGQPADLKADFTTDFHGKLPSGFIGAVGYQFPIADKLSLFAELEYLSINVTRDTSSLGDYSATLGGTAVPSAQLQQMLAANPLLQQLVPLLSDDAQWGTTALPSSKAPYSSFGINFGVKYSF